MPYYMDIKMWPAAPYLNPCSHLAMNQQGVCRFRAMQTPSNTAALPTSTASRGGCKGSHMPSPKLLPKYIFNETAASFCGFLLFNPATLDEQDWETWIKPTAALQSSGERGYFLSMLQPLASASGSAAELHDEALWSVEVCYQCLSKLRCISAVLKCVFHLQMQTGGAGLWREKWCPPSLFFHPVQFPYKQALG